MIGAAQLFSVAWKFRSIIGAGLLILAFIGGVLWMKRWHTQQVAAVYVAGEAAEAARWRATVEVARLKREAELESAQLALDMLEADRLALEERTSVEREEMKDALEKALAQADPPFSRCFVPGRMLDQLRKQNRTG